MHWPEPGNITVEVFGTSDVGRSRDHNEDSFVIYDPRQGRLNGPDSVKMPAPAEGMLFMVADGMGGAAAGEVASAMAVDTVVDVLAGMWESSPGVVAAKFDFSDSLRRATESANARIHSYASENSEHRGMGTTATIAALRADTVFLSQVGDSRAYLARAGSVHQLTRDQSLMQRLVDAGELTAEEAEQSDRRNIILQALGPEPSIRSDISYQQLEDGDILILCSDGLSGQVSAADMERIIASSNGMREICEDLIALANERGGPDNITVIAARFSGFSEQRSDSSDHDVGYKSFATEGGETWRFTPPDSTDNFAGNTAEWLRASLSQSVDLPPQPATKSTHAKGEDGFSRAVLYGILAAVAAGLALVLYRHFFTT